MWSRLAYILLQQYGQPSNPSNYRPIALTCTCCKILESIISNELAQYLLEHKLITPHQHGFLKRHSTSTNLLETTNDWSIALSNRLSVTIAYIDFKSAFDRISHPKLLLKLSSYGVRGNLYLWIASFLFGRSQIVKINSSFSHSCQVTSGVPQGSVLGPLLFNLFINDIIDHLHTSTAVKLFADDIKLYTTFTNINPSNLQTQLNIIHLWSDLWQLGISYPKCNILTIGPHADTSTYSLGTHPITSVDSVNDLGITLDSKLNFKTHINKITSTANIRKSLILRCFLSHNPINLTQAFKIYIRPLLEYASTIWSPSYISEITLLESVQRDFTKRVPGCSHLTYAERLSILGLQSLEHRRLIADLIMTFNIISKQNSIGPNFFKFNTNNNLRGHPFKLSVPLAKTNIQKFHFSNRIVSAWNSLPTNLVTSSSTFAFKRQIRKINLDKYLVFPSIYS